jgi:2-polyprenyl-3-methyl-5-hydroxy-6-metoxy-1,4-benzoquinol methylase
MAEPEQAHVYDGVIDLNDRNNPRTKVVGRVRAGSRVLEVGCATGFMGEYLTQQKQCIVKAVEVDPVAAERARARGLDVVLGSIEDARILETVRGTYDYILFGDVLEHLADPERTLTAVSAFLADGGSVLASIPNVAHWSVRWRLLAGRFDYTRGGLLDETHLRFFTRRTISLMVERAGLEMQAIDTVYRMPIRFPLPHAVRRGIAAALPGLCTWQYVVSAGRKR